MQQSTDLQNLLHSVHRKSYPAYKSLKGSYQFDNYILSIDHVQGDPFASPSHISVRISHKTAGFPREYYSDHVTRITLSDYLTRQFEKQVSHYTFRAKGSGKSGLISVSHCGQEILERTACEITEKGITARFFIGFPANGKNPLRLSPGLRAESFPLQKYQSQRTGTDYLSRRRPDLYPKPACQTKSRCFCRRWLHSSTRKRHFLSSNESLHSFYLTGISARHHGSSAQRQNLRHGNP